MDQEHDVIVVGLGVGGEEVTGRLADADMDVLAVERKLVGGECPYWGCIPSKVMVRAGNSLAEAARAVGLAGQTTISPEWAPVARRVREFTAGWDDSVAVERHEKKGETFVRGDAHVVGPRAVEVDGHRFTARRGLVMATGGEPGAPPIDGLADVDYWTNREAIEAEELPKSMIVLGAGAIGLELAQTFHRFGTEITIVEVAEHALPMEEPENGEALGEVLRSEGVKLLIGASATRIVSTGAGVKVDLEGGDAVEAERLLVATGRRVDLKSLGVENIDLDPEARGIDTDPHLRAGDGVWAVGDVTGVAAFTHLAVYQGRIAAADILGRDHRPADYSAIPRVTFTDPEVASVGLSEALAEQNGINVRTGIAPTSSSSRGAIHGPGAEHGFTKLVADADAGILVGASTIGPAAGEVLGLLVLAVKEKVPISALKDLIYPYPTFVRGLEGALEQLPH